MRSAQYTLCLAFKTVQHYHFSYFSYYITLLLPYYLRLHNRGRSALRGPRFQETRRPFQPLTLCGLATDGGILRRYYEVRRVRAGQADG